MNIVNITSLQKHGINWGYFIDHNQAMPHCNAHPNNLILVAPNKVYGYSVLFKLSVLFRMAESACWLQLTLTLHSLNM